MLRRIFILALIGAASVMLVVAPAWAHQIASNNGVSVQVHVNPDDEPIAGTPTTIWVVRVKNVKGKGTFSWATCRCQLKVFDSSGTVLQSGRGQDGTDGCHVPRGEGLRNHVLGPHQAKRHLADLQGLLCHPRRCSRGSLSTYQHNSERALK